MKENKHQNTTFEETLEQIEQIIAGIEPDTVVRISDIAGMVNCNPMDNAVANAMVMLLKKYGIKYRK